MQNHQLVVGTGSTWSIRAWICLKLANVDFSEYVVVLENADYKQKLLDVSPTGLVPVLNTGSISIHDSLAIAEYANECSNGAIYPAQQHKRALARSLCSELHSGFMHLRTHCPFTLSQQPSVSLTPELIAEINRLNVVWSQAQGSFYFDEPSVVDAFYAVLAFRLKTYGIELSPKASAYQHALLTWPLFSLAIEQARQWG